MSIDRPIRAALAAGVFLAIPTIIHAQEATPGADIVLSPGRSAQSIARSGSAVTVIRPEENEKASPKSTVEILRQVPGVSVVENGGPGQTATVRIRGFESRHTLVLVDGIRVNDPSSGSAEFDFASLVPGDIERIEVLRGPQSALYGSDAVGGVISIITRKGRGAARAVASVEAGRYGILAGKAAISGGNQTFDYALSIAGAKGAGFSAYGYRIARLTAANGGPFENDSFARAGGSGRLAWRPTGGVEIEAGFSTNYNRSQYDGAFPPVPDTLSTGQARLTTGFVKATIDSLDNRLKNTFTLFSNQTNRSYSDISYLDLGFGLVREWDRYAYIGRRDGFEYQGDLALGDFGKLVFGGKIEQERLISKTMPIETSFNVPDRTTARQQTRSLFALYQLPLGDRVDLSFGGRMDDMPGSERFLTWRTTGAYRIDEFGTKFRASIGTGAKAPSLVQLKSPQWGTSTLEAEKSFGIDAGIDQKLFNGRLTLSGSVFHNRIRNLIDFSPYDLTTFTYAICPVRQIYTGCFINVGKAQTSGAELAADAVLIEGTLQARASYTHLMSKDLSTGLHLPRRPEHSGRVSLRWTPTDKLSIEPSVQLVGARYSSANEKHKLAPYARFDLRADYQATANFGLYLRGENLTNARYQEIHEYGSTGRAVYLGATARW